MKPYLFVMSVCVIYSCRQSPQLPEGRKIPLVDSVGVITIDLPSEYDTAYSWVHYGEKGKDYMMYRYQSKVLPCRKENDGLGNSDRLTVFLSIDKIYDTARSIKRERHEIAKDEKLLIDTICNISGNEFYISGRNLQQDSFYLQTVEASTVRKGRTLTLLFEKRSPGTDTSFIRNTSHALLAMRLD